MWDRFIPELSMKRHRKAFPFPPGRRSTLGVRLKANQTLNHCMIVTSKEKKSNLAYLTLTISTYSQSISWSLKSISSFSSTMVFKCCTLTVIVDDCRETEDGRDRRTNWFHSHKRLWSWSKLTAATTGTATVRWFLVTSTASVRPTIA